MAQQLDVRTAFLHGDIDGDIFVDAAEGVTLCSDDQMLKLQKGLYGLRQAPGLWYNNCKTVMSSISFKRLLSEDCVFRRDDVWILLYVDDIVLIGKNGSELESVKSNLRQFIELKDMGSLCLFLGVLIVRDEKGAWLSQRHYISQLLKKFGMKSCKTVLTPMVQGAMNCFADAESSPTDKTKFQELLGSLLFISTKTRTDISAAVSILCRYTSNPREVHWNALKRILRYLRVTIDFCLPLRADDDTVLRAFCDVDWANDRDDRRSRSGILLQLGCTTIAWKTRKQSTVALSTTEAEFVALSDGYKANHFVTGSVERTRLPTEHRHSGHGR